MGCGGRISLRGNMSSLPLFQIYVFFLSEMKLNVTLPCSVSLQSFSVPAGNWFNWGYKIAHEKRNYILCIHKICWMTHFSFHFYAYFFQWSMTRNSYQCGGIIESSDLTYHGSLRVRRSLLRSFVYIKTSSMNATIMRPSASASTRCLRNTLIGEHGYMVMWPFLVLMNC